MEVEESHLKADIVSEVLRERILLSDASGNVLETPEEIFLRVVWHVAVAGRGFASSSEVRETARSFCRMMQNFDFLPNSPTLVNAGIPGAQLSACFVVPIEDSMDSIFKGLRAMALIQKTGGGRGFSFSSLRPRGDLIGTSGGESSGPVFFVARPDATIFQRHVENA